MAKTTESKKQINPEHEDFFDDIALPEEGQKVVGDVEAYWDPEKSAIRFKPLSVRMFDSDMEPKRASYLITGITTSAARLYMTTEEKDDRGKKIRDYNVYPAGTAVGVWYKPGMKGIVNRHNVDCYLKKSGEKDTGKPNPMTLFDLVADKETNTIPVTEDYRDKSKDVKTPFDKIKNGGDQEYPDAF
jgi:hypothetical protein